MNKRDDDSPSGGVVDVVSEHLGKAIIALAGTVAARVFGGSHVNGILTAAFAAVAILLAAVALPGIAIRLNPALGRLSRAVLGFVGGIVMAGVLTAIGARPVAWPTGALDQLALREQIKRRIESGIYRRPPANDVGFRDFGTLRVEVIREGEGKGIYFEIPFRWEKDQRFELFGWKSALSLRVYDGSIAISGRFRCTADNKLTTSDLRVSDFSVTASQGVLTFLIGSIEGPILSRHSVAEKVFFGKLREFDGPTDACE
jgi:hypothetical protein